MTLHELVAEKVAVTVEFDLTPLETTSKPVKVQLWKARGEIELVFRPGGGIFSALV